MKFSSHIFVTRVVSGCMAILLTIASGGMAILHIVSSWMDILYVVSSCMDIVYVVSSCMDMLSNVSGRIIVNWFYVPFQNTYGYIESKIKPVF